MQSADLQTSPGTYTSPVLSCETTSFLHTMGGNFNSQGVYNINLCKGIILCGGIVHANTS